MSFCTSATVAAKSAVIAPIHATTVPACSEPTRPRGRRTRARGTMRNTPAVTIVAAWMSAETGVGPSIASGSQTCSGNCALLPIAPRKNSSAIAVTVPCESDATAAGEPGVVERAASSRRSGTSRA